MNEKARTLPILQNIKTMHRFGLDQIYCLKSWMKSGRWVGKQTKDLKKFFFSFYFKVNKRILFFDMKIRKKNYFSFSTNFIKFVTIKRVK